MAILLGLCCVPAHAELPATGQGDCQDGGSLAACTPGNSKGMSYVKLGPAGEALDAAASAWTCVRDAVTGLAWEAKTADGGLHDQTHRHAWFSGDAGRNGGEAGGPGSTVSCAGSLGAQACTTANYIAAVNAANYCGASDWRLPSQAELLSLVHAGVMLPTIDTGFFPHTANAPYWSTSTNAMIPTSAWGVHFGYGAAHAESKAVPNAVRLVRGTWRP